MHFKYRLILMDTENKSERSIVGNSLDEIRNRIDMLLDDDFDLEMVSSF